MENKIIIATDHAGYTLKEYIKTFLEGKGYHVHDIGTNSTESVDYPDFAHGLAKEIENHTFKRGILLCGSGIGVSIAANRHRKIRAALCWHPDLAELSRLHNNANVLCLPSKFVSQEEAEQIVSTFLETEFEGGRHERRVNKIELT